MALLVSDHDGNSPKVWQPWYINADSEGVHKELPSRAHREQRVKDRTPLYKQYKRFHNMNSLKDIKPIPKRVYGPPEYIGYIPQTTAYNDDLPLDMSMKRRSLSPVKPTSTNMDDRLCQPPPDNGSCSPPIPQHLLIQSLPGRSTHVHPESPHSVFRVSYDQSEAVRERPSVITCTSTRYLNNYSPSTEENRSSLPPPPPYSIATAHLRENIHITLSEVPSSLEIKKVPSPCPNIQQLSSIVHSTDERKVVIKKSAKRQLVQASPVDPEIDEHFRRSLGTHYHQFFSSSPPPADNSDSNDSVDDHFAKALGETWRKLKANKTEHRTERFVPEGSNAFRSQTPPSTAFKGTADVSITRVSVPNSTSHGS